MTTPSSQSKFRPILVTVLLLGGFMTFLFMYIKPSPQWLYEPVKSVVCSDQFTSTTEQVTSKNIQSNTTNGQVTPAKSDEKKTILLVWLVPFGQQNDLNFCKSRFNMDYCIITTDKNMYSKADGLLFHHRDIRGDLSNLPQTQRPPYQKWIWFNMESPTHSGNFAGLDNFFNLTLNYHRDADIPARYGYLVKTQNEKKFELPSKSKLVCWIVSNYNPNHARTKYYNELRQHIEVSTFGRGFGRYVSDGDYANIVSGCKFYLSFENSIHKDYITEKMYRPLSLGTVPVVLGTSRQNYEDFVPGDSFIHTNDFKSPKELADYLHVLDKNDTLYMRYLDWKKLYEVKGTAFWIEHACRACEYLRTDNEYKAFRSLRSWYWG